MHKIHKFWLFKKRKYVVKTSFYYEHAKYKAVAPILIPKWQKDENYRQHEIFFCAVNPLRTLKPDMT